MVRRRTLTSSLLKTAESVGVSARRVAREREKSVRQEHALAERDARALARLARQEERELALAAAAEEHAENEALLLSIREVLLRAPATIRDASDYEPLLLPAPFLSSSRAEVDRARRDREVNARLASIRLPRPMGLLVSTGIGVVMALAGVVWCFTTLWAGVVCLVLGSLLAVVSAWKASLQEQALLAAAGTRIGEEVTAEIERDLQRDLAVHEGSERARIARLRALLAGEERICVEVFQAAVDAVELPFDASAVVGMASTDLAEIQVNLPALEEIPLQRSTLLKTGRITYRNRPRREVQEDDAWAVASLCFLYAALAFDALPTLDTIVLSAFRPGVDPATGGDAECCYASVILDREAFLRLKLDRLDPIAALRSLQARFSCSATHLLKAVEPFAMSDLATLDAAATGVEDGGALRSRWLAALDLPPDGDPDRPAVERALRRMEDVYAEDKFALVAPELRDLARARLDQAREASTRLLRELPAPPTPPPLTAAEAITTVRRQNEDLDSIFGA